MPTFNKPGDDFLYDVADGSPVGVQRDNGAKQMFAFIKDGQVVDANQSPVSGGGSLGTFSSPGALETAFPAAANTGNTAMVGSAAPYAQYVSNGSTWVVTAGAGGAATLGANSFTAPQTVQTMKLGAPDSGQVIIGYLAGAARLATTQNSEDTIIGNQAGNALAEATNTYSTFIGSFAGNKIVTGSGNVAVGQKALISATSSGSVTAVGGKAGSTVVAPMSDTFIGYAAGQFLTATNLGRRVHVGYAAGQYDNGDYNVYVGWSAGSQVTTGSPAGNPTSGSDNIGIGRQSLTALAGGSLNIAIGGQAGRIITTGAGGVYIGHNAGFSKVTGAFVAVGYQAGYNITGSDNVFLGSSAGDSCPAATSNTFVAGSNASGGAGRIDNVFFGKGFSAATPTRYTINGTAGAGTDIAGGDVRIGGGAGTGTGAGGKVVLSTAPAGSTGTVANALVDVLELLPQGYIFVKNATTVPASNPTGGGNLFVEGGALKWRGSSGTVTVIAPA